MLCSEITENISSFSLSEEIEKISRECSEFLTVARQQGYPLLRGSKNAHLAKYYIPGMSNRLPKDSSKSFQAAIDIGLQQLGIEALRSNSIFVSSRKDVAETYGQLYYVFPFNGFKFSWSPRISDMYDWHERINQAAYRLFSNNMQATSAMADSMLLDKAESQPAMMGRLLEHFGYTDQDLGAAMHSGHEILISGPCMCYQRGHTEIEQLVKGLLYAK